MAFAGTLAHQGIRVIAMSRFVYLRTPMAADVAVGGENDDALDRHSVRSPKLKADLHRRCSSTHIGHRYWPTISRLGSQVLCLKVAMKRPLVWQQYRTVEGRFYVDFQSLSL